MESSNKTISRGGRVFLWSVAIGAAVGFVLGLVGEPALEGSDVLGGQFHPLALLYLFFCLPALQLLPWQIHDIPVLRGVLSGVFWGLLVFAAWGAFRLWKTRRERMDD